VTQKLFAMSTIQHINAYLDRIPVQMQLQVLHFIERLAQKKVQAIPAPPRPTFRFIGLGDSGGALNQIANLRDFAYDD
jgi:hypothetical protein